MKQKKLDKILKLHKLWLNGDKKGVRANLYGANLSGANLNRADLREANLYGADLNRADLREADLREANLREADLGGAIGYTRSVYPEEGSFTCYKKCISDDKEYIVTLRIPSKANRVGAIGSRKFRVSEAKVTKIETLDGERVNVKVTGKTYSGIEYSIGNIVVPDSFDESDRVECSNGIHCFISKQEAKEY